MKKKTTKTKGGRGDKKQKDSAIPASPLLIPQDHQEDKLQAMLAALPVLEGPKPPPEPELQPTFEGVKDLQDRTGFRLAENVFRKINRSPHKRT
jgi:hypothetical protein